MDLYIHGTGIVSAAGNNAEPDFLATPPDYNTSYLPCKEPDYTGIIPPMQLRRLSKAVRMGIASAKICLNDAGIEKPDALSVGTAMGCLYDTEIFLSKMIAQDEQMLTPTSFIQSTHNTVGGAIALLTACYGHNLTFVHRGHSFEHALMNAQLYLDSHPNENILTGGIDELIDVSREIMQELGVYRKENATAQEALHTTTKGSIAGEGASFFLTGKEPAPQSLCIKQLYLFTATDTQDALQHVALFLQKENIHTKDIDLVMLGINGDANYAEFYTHLSEQLFKNNSRAAFKHLCGDYGTASAFALGLLSQSVKNGIPDFIMLNEKPAQLKNIILVNQFTDHYSCWQLQVG